jgi:SAM-dependent methyltransferase
MRRAQLSLEQYDTDKISNHYLERYDPLFEPWVDRSVTLLELGIRNGGSLLLWRDYFPRGTIVGLDIKVPEHFQPTDRVRLFEGSQTDRAFLSRVANETAPEGFDIIIDDASHVGEFTKVSFWHLFENHLKPGGLYVIEDWGTGYWDDWFDGRSLDLSKYERPKRYHHQAARIVNKLGLKMRIPFVKSPFPNHAYGMVGFIKQLVDEQGAADVIRKRNSGTSGRASKFDSVLITPSIVFIRKAAKNVQSASAQ